jgi:PIN domain nuclease of toxin-antitoxin system
MRLLLDTHAFLWWLDGDAALSPAARTAIADETNEVFVSAASSWEIATKFRLGKLPGAAPVASDVAGALAAQGFTELPITVRHGETAGALPGPHRDPFDRMLIAQATIEHLVFVSNDGQLDGNGARRLW